MSNVFGDIILFLSSIPKFEDTKLILKNSKVVSINKIVFSAYSKKILELVFLSENEGYLCLDGIDEKYFNILKKFIYERNELEWTEEVVAYMIFTLFIFDVPRMQKFVLSIFKKVDPIQLFYMIKAFAANDKLNSDVANKSFIFFAENIDIDVINEENILMLGKESIELISRYLPLEKKRIRGLFQKYQSEINTMLRQLSIFGSKEAIDESTCSKLSLLRTYADKDCIEICGLKKWFTYIVNWFFYSYDRNVYDFSVFMDFVVDCDEICTGLIKKILVEFEQRLGNVLSADECKYFVRCFNKIKKSTDPSKCCCKYCKQYFFYTISNDTKSRRITENSTDFFNNVYDNSEITLRDKCHEGSISSTNYTISHKTFSTYGPGSLIYSSAPSMITTNVHTDDTSTLFEERSNYIEKLKIFDNSIIIAGGNFANNKLYDYDIYSYDILRNKCGIVDSICTGREECKIEYKDGNIFVFGGKNRSGEKIHSIKALNIKNGEIKNMNDSFSCGRTNHATILQDDYVYIIGGKLDDKNETIVQYNLKYEKKSLIFPDKPFEIIDHSLCKYENTIYIFGGIKENKLKNMLIFDPRSKDRLIKCKSPPIPIFRTSIVQNANVITSFGGAEFSNNRSELIAHDKIFEFDPRADKWIQCDLHCGRPFYSGGSCYINESFYTFGGYDFNSNPQNEIYIFKDKSWNNIANFPVSLAGFDFFLLP
ncbi:Galactose oxidase/kelch, beta-propeller domain and Kelch-type beta propeller domain-containing protein [Strongyloides ratti]|uniref:Galactose oxidase/kelch, beta-propeller domain and Kelch-type beta propeller domain-containing protein n=1 Tax=Strongyloides ratti TaxID=34506 RepID=A0A090LK25_STRRB|nr:Galactose oxidase/kelch, beta-propeller domain and Kelch-type beta propeller domain-containing protein [Strongyloides ratti]CEF68493.1 Galactose oxidase/kelch, beta-propeller domain and Kelch-type beta propeller domain-containing protein [Strongyloides ratti]